MFELLYIFENIFEIQICWKAATYSTLLGSALFGQHRNYESSVEQAIQYVKNCFNGLQL